MKFWKHIIAIVLVLAASVSAQLQVQVGTTSKSIPLFLQDSSSTTGAGLASLVYNSAGLTAYYVRDGGSSTAITLATLSTATSAFSSGGFKEMDGTNMPGMYRLDLPDAVLASGAKWASIYLKGATNLAPRVQLIELTGTSVQDATFGGIARLQTLPSATFGSQGGGLIIGANVGTLSLSGAATLTGGVWGGVNSATPGIIAGTLNLNGGSLNVATFTAANVGLGTTTAGTGTAIFNGRVVNVTLVDTATTVTNAVPANVTQQNGVADLIRQNTATDGASTTITLDASASSSNSFYVGLWIRIISGTGSYQERLCTAYVGATKVATVDRAWLLPPDNTSVFQIVRIQPINVVQLNSTAQTARDIGAGVVAQGGTITTVTTLTNLPAITAGWLTATGIAADAITDAKVASDVTIASVTGAVGSVTGGVTVTTNNDKTGYRLSATGVDDVWDEAISGHLTAGSTGNALNAAGSAGDPWSTPLPGAYGAGTAGKIVGDNLNATVSSRATQVSVDDVPTNAELATALGTADDATLAAIAALNNLSQANIRTAVGLAGANLDSQLDALPTNAELATSQAGADDATLAAIAALNNLSAAQVNAEVDTALADVGLTLTVTGRIDAAVSTRSSHSAADVWAVATRALTDKSGFSLSASQTFNLTGNITGNLSGSVGSVTGFTTANIGSILTIANKLDTALELDGSVYRYTTNALEQGSGGGGGGFTTEDRTKIYKALKIP